MTAIENESNMHDEPHVDEHVNEDNSHLYGYDQADKFKMHLAQELGDNHDLLNSILYFNQSVKDKVDHLSKTVSEKSKELEDERIKYMELNERAIQTQNFAQKLMANVPFATFATPEPDLSFSPQKVVEQTLAKLENNSEWGF